ncbi:hypothetical protein Agub_g11148 [Astrephomene gubernaculifera]|uniref:Uncharacterized protein n=1 Tax=Astrephomene gubernaculifera TaxID=47775 RepID=A0AAD3HQI4_9CHLO|nr:hypothetical protein Agub_g11148 [Astrephomene gubernaculifera]
MRDSEDHQKMLAQLLEEHHLRQTAEDVLRQARVSHGSTMRFHIDSSLHNPPKMSLVRLQYGAAASGPPPSPSEATAEAAGDLITGSEPPKSITVKPVPRFGSMTLACSPFTAAAAAAASGGGGDTSAGLKVSPSSDSLCDAGDLRVAISAAVPSGAFDTDGAVAGGSPFNEAAARLSCGKGASTASFRTRMVRSSTPAADGALAANASHGIGNSLVVPRAEGILAGASVRCKPRRISGTDHPAAGPARRLARTPGVTSSTDGYVSSFMSGSASTGNVSMVMPASGGSGTAVNGIGSAASGSIVVVGHCGREAWQTGPSSLSYAGSDSNIVAASGTGSSSTAAVQAGSARGSLSPRFREASFGAGVHAGPIPSSGAAQQQPSVSGPKDAAPGAAPAASGQHGGAGARRISIASATGSSAEDSAGEALNVYRNGPSISAPRSAASFTAPHHHHHRQQPHHHQPHPHHQQHQSGQQHPAQPQEQSQQHRPQQNNDQPPQVQQQQQQQQQQHRQQQRRAFQHPSVHPHVHETGGALRPTPLCLPTQPHAMGRASPPPASLTTTPTSAGLASPGAGAGLSSPLMSPSSPSPSQTDLAGLGPGPGPCRVASASFHCGAAQHPQQPGGSCSGSILTSHDMSAAMMLLSRVSRVTPKPAPPQEWTVDLHSLEADGAGAGGGGGATLTPSRGASFTGAGASFGSGYSFGVYGQALGRRAGSALFRGGPAGEYGGGAGQGLEGDSGLRRLGADVTAAGVSAAAAGATVGASAGSHPSSAPVAVVESGAQEVPGSSDGAGGTAAAANAASAVAHPQRNLPRQLPALARYRGSTGGGPPSARGSARRKARRASVGMEEGRPSPSSPPPSSATFRPRPPSSPYNARPGTAVAGGPLSPSLHQHQPQLPHGASLDGRPLSQQVNAEGEMCTREELSAGMQGPSAGPAAPTTAAAVEAAACRRPRFANLAAGDAGTPRPSYPGVAGVPLSPTAPRAAGSSACDAAGNGGSSLGGNAACGVGGAVGGQASPVGEAAQTPQQVSAESWEGTRPAVTREEHASIMTRMKKALSFLRRGD